MTDVRAVAVGVPDRLKGPLLGVRGVVVVPDLITAAGVLEDWPLAYVLYGEELFGMAVSGQPVLLLATQAERLQQQVMVVADCHPQQLGELPWDDPRRLAAQAGVRVRASRYVDLSESSAWGRLDEVLDRPLTPP